MDSPATFRVGVLIREERTRRRMEVVELARLAGVSPATISRLERGKQAGVTIALADRILTAMDLRLHVETVPLWADIDESIAEASRQSLTDRITTWPVDFVSFISRLDGIPYMLDGLTAAALQGAPVKVEEIEIAVPRNVEVLDRLTFLLEDFMVRRGEGLERIDPREPGSDYYTCLACRFRIRLIEDYRPGLWVDIDPMPEPTCFLPSVRDLPVPPPLTKARLAVVPLAEIQASDSHARRVIERVRTRLE